MEDDDEVAPSEGPLEVRHDRVAPNDVTLMSWCPKMDLLAVVLHGTEVAIHRLNWHRARCPIVVQGGPITCLEWAPDGRSLALGVSDGSVAIYDVQQQAPTRHTELVDDVDPDQHTAGNLVIRWQVAEVPVTALAWASLEDKPERKIPSVRPSRNQDDAPTDPFNLLACGCANGALSIFAMNLSLELATKRMFDGAVRGIAFLCDMSALVVVAHSPSRLRVIGVANILALAAPIRQVAVEVQSVKADLRAASAPLNKIWSSYRALSANVRGVILQVEESAAAYPEDEIAQVGRVSEMFGLIVHGGRSPAVFHYLMRSVTFERIKKLDQTAKRFLEEQVRLLTSKGGPAWQLQRVIERMSRFRARTLSALENLNIPNEGLTRVIELLSLTVMTLEMASITLESWGVDVQNFCLWLRLVAMVMWQQENENGSVAIDKTDNLISRPTGKSIRAFVDNFLSQKPDGEPGCWGDFASHYDTITAQLRETESVFIQEIVQVPSQLLVQTINVTEELIIGGGIAKPIWFGGVHSNTPFFEIWQEHILGVRTRTICSTEEGVWGLRTEQGPIFDCAGLLACSLNPNGKTVLGLFSGEGLQGSDSNCMFLALAHRAGTGSMWQAHRVAGLNSTYRKESEADGVDRSCLLEANHARGLASVRIGSRRIVVVDLIE